MKRIPALFLFAAFACHVQAQDPRVWLDTDMGPIIVELDPGAAPTTVENFLRYVDDGFYDGMIFHRVVEDFVIQSGGFEDGIVYKEPTYEAIENEADNGLSNQRGTIAMARSSEPDSATSQFFFNLEDNGDLDPGQSTEAGYAVFGEIVIGLATMDAIGALPASSIGTPYGTLRDYPRNPPVIHRAVRTEGFPLMADHSGSWYDPDNSGVGFNIEIANNAAGEGPIAIVYWYNFADGKPFWLTGQASFQWGDGSVTVDLYSAEGGSFQNVESDFEKLGTLTLSFDGCASGSFDFDLIDQGAGQIDVVRLSRPDGFRCQDG